MPLLVGSTLHLSTQIVDGSHDIVHQARNLLVFAHYTHVCEGGGGLPGVLRLQLIKQGSGEAILLLHIAKVHDL